MSDSEDYMSMKIVENCESANIRPSLLVNKEKRKHQLYKKSIESSSKKQKTVRELEHENREAGLSTALSSENKGYKMLARMGYKVGESLGKSNAGLKEPIDIKLKQNSSGVGRENHIKEVVMKKQQQKTKNLKHYEAQFQKAFKEKKKLAQLRNDFFKAQRACEELDLRLEVKCPKYDFFWTKDTIKRIRNTSKRTPQKNISSSSEDTDSDERSSSDEEFEEQITEENLFAIINYLRVKYLFCMYCGFKANDCEDLKSNCPGPHRTDHDDE